MSNIAIFASGSGTNAENIIKYFSNKKTANVVLILSNRREAPVLKRAEQNNVDHFFSTEMIFIFPAGFLINLFSTGLTLSFWRDFSGSYRKTFSKDTEAV